MFSETVFKCEGCDATITSTELKKSDWLVFSHPDIVGAMVICCPGHITGYALRLLRKCRKSGGSEMYTRQTNKLF